MHPARVYVLFMVTYWAALAFTFVNYTFFLVDIGIDIGGIALINVAHWIAVSLSEVPTGMVADTRGRGWSVRMGVVIQAVFLIAYAFVNDMSGAVICEIALGIAGAFISGAHSAWVTDALKKSGEAHRLQEVFGKATAARTAATLISGTVGGLLSTTDTRIPWIVSGVLMLCAYAFARKFMNGDGEVDRKMGEREALLRSVHLLKAQRALLWVTVAVMLYGLVMPVNTTWNLLFRERVGQTATALFWPAVMIPMLLGSLAVARLTVFRSREAGALVFTFGLIGVGLTGAAICGGIVIPFSMFILHEFARGCFWPLSESFVQSRVESGCRATFGSLQSLLSRAVFGMVLLAQWWFTAGSPVNEAAILPLWLVCGSLFVVAATALWLFRPRSEVQD